MKPVVLVSVALVMLPCVAFSEEAPVPLSERPNVVFLAPAVSLGGSSVSTEGGVAGVYERVLAPRFAFTVGLAVAGDVSHTQFSGSDFNENFHSGAFGVQVQPGVRFFLTEKAPSGLWVGPRLEGGYDITRSSFPAVSFQKGGSVGVSALVGYSHVFAGGFFLEAAAGAGVTYTVTNGGSPGLGIVSFGSGNTSSSSDVSIAGRFELGLGYAF